MAVQRVYSDEERKDVIAAIIAGGSIRGVAEARGIPYETAREWWHASEDGARQLAQSPAKQPYDHVALWSEASARAARVIGRTLERYEAEDRHLDPGELQRVAIVGGIATDKHLDHRDGRTKGGVSIDNRQVHVQLTSEQAAALVAEAQRRGQLTTQDQPTAPTLPEAPPPPTT